MHVNGIWEFVFYSLQRSYSSVIVFLTYFLALLDQVVKLIDVFPYGTGFVLVFEYMLSDLSEVLRNSARPLTEVCSRDTVHYINFSKQGDAVILHW